jgi:hypothetical protein
VLELTWQGVRYQGRVPANLSLPAVITIEGVEEPPRGDLVLVLRRKPRVLDLFRSVAVFQARVEVGRAPASEPG